MWDQMRGVGGSAVIKGLCKVTHTDEAHSKLVNPPLTTNQNIDK